MPIETLSDQVRQFCSQNRLKLNKDLGQHFLIDQDVLDRIIGAAQIQPEDHIVEIGPGIGILTKELLRKGKKVTAIELDERMIPLLEKYVGPTVKCLPAVALAKAGQLSIVNSNALKVSLPNTPYKIVANIPYHITSPLLRHAFLESGTPPVSMTLLIQKEVAEKICDVKSAGMLTVLVGLFGKPELIMSVPPESFLPPPKVDSAVLHIDCFAEPLADQETLDEVFRLTKAAFGQKRKMLKHTVGAFLNGTERLFAAAIDEKRRPQELSVEEWVRLAQTA